MEQRYPQEPMNEDTSGVSDDEFNREIWDSFSSVGIRDSIKLNIIDTTNNVVMPSGNVLKTSHEPLLSEEKAYLLFQKTIVS